MTDRRSLNDAARDLVGFVLGEFLDRVPQLEREHRIEQLALAIQKRIDDAVVESNEGRFLVVGEQARQMLEDMDKPVSDEKRAFLKECNEVYKRTLGQTLSTCPSCKASDTVEKLWLTMCVSCGAVVPTISGPAHQSTESVNRTEPLGDAEKAQRSDAGGAPEPGAHEASGEAPLVWWCPQCGPCRAEPPGIDRDGLCTTCGATCGEITDPRWYEDLLARAYECIEQMAPVGARTDAIKYDIRRALR